MKICCFYDSELVEAVDDVIDCWSQIKSDQYTEGEWDLAVIEKVRSVLKNFHSRLKEKQLLTIGIRQQSLPYALEAQEYFNRGEIAQSRKAFESLRAVIATFSS